MEGGDVLIVVAEVAAAFAGFAGIVAIFRHRGSAGWDPYDAFRFRFMVECSLGTVAFAILPFVLHHLGATPRYIWSTCSVLLALNYLGLLVSSRIRVRGLRGASGAALNIPLAALIVGGALASILLLLLNALQVGFEGKFGPYLVGLAWLLTSSGLFFLRLLLLSVTDSDSREL